VTEHTAGGFTPSANIAFLKESATIAVSARAKALKAAGRHVIDLGAGEPDFDTPPFIRAAAARAVENGATHYTATEGILPLREAIAADAKERYRGAVPVDAKDIVVSNGSKQSLFNICYALFGAGDEVLIPTPSWTSYFEMVALARATAVPVPGDRKRSLTVTAALLEKAATPRTRGIMLNSPSNPSGAVYSADALREILALAERRDWWVISDEIYRRISYDAPAASLLDLAARRERLVIVDGVAKAYAMTGWRIGWAIAPRALATAMTGFQSHTTSNASAASQHAALAALSDRAQAEPAITAMVDEFRERRNAIIEVLRSEPRLEYVPMAGAFYLFARIAPDGAPGDPGAEFAQAMLEKHDVAIVPGSAFGTPSWVRLSYAAPREQVLTGVRKLIELYRERAG
jgi:aspartate aminotransferase